MADIQEMREGAELDADELREWANELKNDMQDIHQQMEVRHRDLVAMMDKPDLAEHLTRSGVVVTMNTPLLGDLADQVISDVHPYNTDITCVPMEQGVEKQCDEREKWLAIWKSTANRGWRVDHDFLWHLFLSSYAGVLFKVRPDTYPDKDGNPQWADFPFELLVPEPSTLSFPVEGAPFIPSVLAREYEQSIWAVERLYAGAAGPFQDSMPVWSDGKMDILPLGEDYKIGTSGKSMGTAKRGEMVSMLEFYTPTMCYVYCINKSGELPKSATTPRTGTNGTLVWYGPNLTGCVPAVIGAGISQPLRTIRKERLQPAFRALYQDVKNQNRGWAQLATIVENSKPELVNQKGPETLKAEAKMPPQSSQQIVVNDDGPAIIDVHGDRMLQWMLQENKNVIEAIQHWESKGEQRAASWRQISDPQTLKDIKANVFLTTAESVQRRLSNVMANKDFMWESMLSMSERVAKALDRPFPLYSVQDVVFGSSKKLKAGELVTLDPDEEFKHILVVSTRSMSEAEQRMRREDMNAQRAAGTATVRQQLAIDYEDVEQQLEDLAIDRMLEHSDISFGAAEVDAATQDAIKLLGGVYIPIGGLGGPSQAAPPTAPTGMPPMRAPVLAGTAASGG